MGGRRASYTIEKKTQLSDATWDIRAHDQRHDGSPLAIQG